MKSWLVDSKVSPLLLSFLAGAASSTIIWWTLSRGRPSLRRRRSSIHDDDTVESWIDSPAWMDEIKSRIGELPSTPKKMRWPWDRKRPPPLVVEEKDTKDDSTTNTTHAAPLKDKTGLCIGNIFGLDVGGTLAKLVYFEQRVNEPVTRSHREQLHHRRASAQVVVQARRSTSSSPRRRSSMTDIGGVHTVDSEQDLQEMLLLRQESLPDDLEELEGLLPQSKFTSQESLVGLMNGETPSRAPKQQPEKSSTSGGGMKRARSMLDISKSRDHAEALDRFYNFARRLDGYETAVKDKNLSFYSRELGGDFHFIRFETRNMENAMHLIRVNDLHQNIVTMGATGGGAHKFAADWEQMLGIKMEKQDELDSLVAGMQFVLSTAIGECYTYRPRLHHHSFHSSSISSEGTDRAGNSNQTEASPRTGDAADESESGDQYQGGDEWWWSRKVQRDAASLPATFPYLLVTIGTGVSVLRVDGPRDHERISGSTIGGGTYWGLMRLLTDVENFEDVMNLAQKGNPAKVDMMVGDIYGKNSDALEKIGLSSNLVASSFGKLVAKHDPSSGVTQEDLARALLLMVTNNIGQVAYLNAQLHKTPRIYFVGNFLRQNQISQQRLSFAIDFWSKGNMEALFLEHEGYFGALGAFLLSQGISRGEDGSFQWEASNDDDDLRSVDDELPSRHRRSMTMV